LRGDGLHAPRLARPARPSCHRAGPAPPRPTARRRAARPGRDRPRGSCERGSAAAAFTMRPLLVVPLVLAGLAAFAATRAPVSDSDFFWHLAVGRDIVARGVPQVDLYSWT